jgi:hypothetical protein
MGTSGHRVGIINTGMLSLLCEDEDHGRRCAWADIMKEETGIINCQSLTI